MNITVKEQVSENTSKKVVAVQLSQEMYNALKTEAQNEFISISDVLRRIVIKHYKDISEEN